MANYPLMFTFRDVVSGDGFLAGITVSGRALMTKEDDEKWWMYGVRPGGVADHGTTPQEAYLRFRDRYKTLLFDIAQECVDFASFKGEVERFYGQPDKEQENLWVSAFRDIRSGAVQVETPFAELPKVSPEKWPTGISILPLHQAQRFTAEDNVPDAYAFAAAA